MFPNAEQICPICEFFRIERWGTMRLIGVMVWFQVEKEEA